MAANKKSKAHPLERFCEKIELLPNGCWIYNGTKATNGYRTLGLYGKTVYSHRISYQIFKGPIPEGLEIDHLCRNRYCSNPDHLEAVTRRENLIRGNTIVAKQIKKTHCPSGHEYSKENTRFSKDKSRLCIICARASCRKQQKKRRDERRATGNPRPN